MFATFRQNQATTCAALAGLEKVTQRQQAYRKLTKQIKEKRTANDKLDASIDHAVVLTTD